MFDGNPETPMFPNGGITDEEREMQKHNESRMAEALDIFHQYRRENIAILRKIESRNNMPEIGITDARLEELAETLSFDDIIAMLQWKLGLIP